MRFLVRRGWHLAPLRRRFAGALSIVAVSLASGGREPAMAVAQANPVGLRLVGQHDLHGRSAYQPVIHAYGSRRILFVGHHAGEARNPMTARVEVNGLSNPRRHQPGFADLSGARAPDWNGGTLHAARAALRRTRAAQRGRLQGLSHPHERQRRL